MSKIIFIPMPVKSGQNVSNAIELIAGVNSKLDVRILGCKDNNLEIEEILQISEIIKSSGKKSILEVMSSESEWLESASLAVNGSFDMVLGTHFDFKVSEYLEKHNICYFPFIGNITADPIVLRGTIAEIVNEAKEVCSKNVTGITVPLYHFEGNFEELARKLIDNVSKPIIVAGKVTTREQIEYLNQMGFYAFTMGTPLVDKKYVKEGTFVENIRVVSSWISEL